MIVMIMGVAHAFNTSNRHTLVVMSVFSMRAMGSIGAERCLGRMRRECAGSHGVMGVRVCGLFSLDHMHLCRLLSECL